MLIVHKISQNNPVRDHSSLKLQLFDLRDPVRDLLDELSYTQFHI